MGDIYLANVCCQQGQSQNTISDNCYQISERLILKSILHNSTVAGIIEDKRQFQNNEVVKKRANKIYNLIRIFRFQIFFWIRNCIWNTGKWKTNELCQYIDEFKPDLIFAQLQDRTYLNDLIVFIKDYLKIPLVVYTWDDVYSLKQFSLSIFYWIDRFAQRNKIRRVVERCSKIYTISYEQSEEYKTCLKKDCSILYKGYNFTDAFEVKKIGNPIKIVYTGNLYGDRWKTVALLCESLKKINQNDIKIQLYIYSATPLLKSQIRKLSIKDTTFFRGGISAKEVIEVQKKADILLHVESFTLKGSMTARLSFSTKIVDYFTQQKCIIAIGHSRCSSIKYLRRNDAAIVIDDKSKIFGTISNIVDDSNILPTYAIKSWQCGVENHQISKIQSTLRADLEKITREKIHS
jgi:hypothetical protein